MDTGKRLWLRACWFYLDPRRLHLQTTRSVDGRLIAHPPDMRRQFIAMRDLEAAGISVPDGSQGCPPELC